MAREIGTVVIVVFSVETRVIVRTLNGLQVLLLQLDFAPLQVYVFPHIQLCASILGAFLARTSIWVHNRRLFVLSIY